jgi:hypothetical protein
VLLGASEDGAIYMWNLGTKEFIGKCQVLNDQTPRLSLAVSPDQKFIACAGLEPHNEIFIFPFKIHFKYTGVVIINSTIK